MRDSVEIGSFRAGRGDEIVVARAGDVGDLRFTVEKIHRYVSGDDEWFEVSGSYNGREVFVEQHNHGAVLVNLSPSTPSLNELGLSEDDLVRMDESRNPSETFSYDGTEWHYRESQEIGWFNDGNPEAEGYYNWDFADSTGERLLSVEKWEGEPFEIILSRVFPADAVQVTGSQQTDAFGGDSSHSSGFEPQVAADDTPVSYRSSGGSGQTFSLLFGCVVVLAIIVVAVGLMPRGLDRVLVARANAELGNFDESKQQFQSLREAIEKSLSEAPTLFQADKLDSTWKTQLDAAQSGLKEADASVTKLDQLLQEDDSESASEVQSLVDSIGASRVSALNQASDIDARSSRMLYDYQQKIAQAWKNAEQEIAEYENASEKLPGIRQVVEKALTEHPDVFEPRGHDKAWPERFDKAATDLEAGREIADGLQTLLKDKSPESQPKVVETTHQLAGLRVAAMTDATRMQEEAEHLVKFKQELTRRLAEIETTTQSIETIDLTGLTTLVSKAGLDWPAKKADLDGRLKRYTDAKSRATTLGTAVKEKGADGNLQQLMSATQQLGQTRKMLTDARKQLPGLVDQLYWSWDRMLVDMEIQEGATVTFRQKFKTVKVRALVPEGEEAQTKDSEEWQTVSKSVWESMKGNLGMVVAHKAAGKYDHEATQLVQPAGYAYMCPPQQVRNHYGYWERRNDGHHFWRFYGQYAFMRSMMRMGGHGISPISGLMWNNYHSHRQSGRTWYGRDELGRNRYGSDGLVTRQSFSGSMFVATNGFKSTQYVKSGGSYRGSRYATPTRSTSSSNRYSGSRYQSGSSSSRRTTTPSRSSSSMRSSSFRSGSRSSGGK